MKRIFVRCCALLAVMVLIIPAEAADIRYPLADKGTIVLTVPDGWREEVRKPGPSHPYPTIIFTPASGPGFHVAVTPIWPSKPDIPKPTANGVRETVRGSAESLKAQSVEKEIKVLDFKGKETFGSYYSVTDRAPKPGEFRYMTQGMMGLDDLRVTFTLLTSEGKETVTPKVIDMMKGARREGAKAKGK